MQRWKNGLEAKGLRVNVGKTKMKCGVGLQKLVDSGKYLVGCVVRVLRPILYTVYLMHEVGTQAL